MEDDVDDLDGLDSHALEQKLSEAVCHPDHVSFHFRKAGSTHLRLQIPQWTNKSNDLSDEDEVDFSIYRRSSSRASNSSGCLSVPASEPIDISDNGESEHEDDDPVLQASLSGLQVAHKRAPAVSSPPVNFDFSTSFSWADILRSIRHPRTRRLGTVLQQTNARGRPVRSSKIIPCGICRRYSAARIRILFYSYHRRSLLLHDLNPDQAPAPTSAMP
jgi:hypothetical protein